MAFALKCLAFLGSRDRKSLIKNFPRLLPFLFVNKEVWGSLGSVYAEKEMPGGGKTQICYLFQQQGGSSDEKFWILRLGEDLKTVLSPPPLPPCSVFTPMSNSKKNIFKTTNFTCLKGLFDDPLNRILSKISLFSHLLDSTGPTIICALNGGFDWSADWLILVFEGKQNMSHMCKSGYDYALFWGWKIWVGIFWAPEHVHHLPDQVNHLPNNPYLTYTYVPTSAQPPTPALEKLWS